MEKPASQFELLTKKRFGPFFATQALGALNDNVFKNALILLLTYGGAHQLGLDANFVINLAAMIFILPFFLFSATAGQLAEKYEKSANMRLLKLTELTIMVIGAIGFITGNLWLLLVLLFLMGTQSTFFGPIKYGILPQHLKKQELVGGNGMVEMGTFLAIIIGMILGGWLVNLDKGGWYTGGVIILVALVGYVASRGIPNAPASSPDLKINWNPATETFRNLNYLRKHRNIFLPVLGISWFWFYGAIFLTQLPNYTLTVIGGIESVSILMMAVFSVGIGVGSMLCELLSGKRVEIGLVPLGAIGMTVFALDFFFASPVDPIINDFVNISQFLQTDGSWRLLIDSVLVGVFGGFYIVPLYAMVQERAERSHLSRVIAGNNILNALFMVVASIVAMLVLGSGFTIPQLFLLTAVLNAIVAIYIFSLVPEFLMRFLTWILIHTVYRVKHQSLHHIPEEGPAVLVSNHVSYLDPLVLGGICPRPVRFVMYHKIYKLPILNFIFRTAKAIPIAPAHEDEALMLRAFDQISECLQQGDLVAIFPEGKITYDGEINEFRTGIEKIVARDPVPVVPVALQGLWDSFFSRNPAKSYFSRLLRLRNKVGVLADKPVPAEEVSAKDLQGKVESLRGDWK